MISLAFNIAVMGFVLVEGIMAYLRNTLGVSQENAGPPQVFLTPSGGGLGTAQPWGHSEGAGLRLFAEKIAAGDMTVAAQNADLLAHVAVPQETIHAALVAGFGWVMAYGAVCVFLLAAISFMIFSPGKTAQRNGDTQGQSAREVV